MSPGVLSLSRCSRLLFVVNVVDVLCQLFSCSNNAPIMCYDRFVDLDVHIAAQHPSVALITAALEPSCQPVDFTVDPVVPQYPFGVCCRALVDYVHGNVRTAERRWEFPQSDEIIDRAIEFMGLRVNINHDIRVIAQPNPIRYLDRLAGPGAIRCVHYVSALVFAQRSDTIEAVLYKGPLLLVSDDL